MKIIVDIWGGELHQEHVARFIHEFDDATELTRTELNAGFLVNLRAEAAWGEYKDFDIRKEKVQ